MQKSVTFTAPLNSNYEGVYFKDGIFVTNDIDKINRLRRSSYYGNKITEIDVDEAHGVKKVSLDTTPPPPTPPMIDMHTHKPVRDAISSDTPKPKVRPKAKKTATKPKK